MLELGWYRLRPDSHRVEVSGDIDWEDGTRSWRPSIAISRAVCFHLHEESRDEDGR
jgi:hypothetical protein